MSSPNASIFEEISDQHLEDLGVGSQVQPNGWTATLIGFTNCIVSYFIGNQGYVCTTTVECQNTCN
jgi:hypothetical protein